MILGLDVGGTNIDGVIIENQKIVNKIKLPIKRGNLLESIIESLQVLLLNSDKTKIKRINLSTTISTNAIVEKTIDKVGMIIQSGPGLGSSHLACGHANGFIEGSIDHRGTIVKDIDPSEVSNIINNFKKENIEACSVVTKFSTRNPSVEKQIKESIVKDFDVISMGHSLSGKLNFPRRVYTAYLNSAVSKTFEGFALAVEETLAENEIDAPVFVLKADGGTMKLEEALERPVETILSGPAASFMGTQGLLDMPDDSLILDIGGTTTDIFFLVDGLPLFEPLGIKIDGYPTLIRSIYSVSIGVGGNSEIKVKDNNMLIGPRNAGNSYAQGGDIPTPTDAMIYLEKLDMGDYKKASKAMGKLGSKLNLSKEDTANLILATMANMIKEKVDSLLEGINAKPVYTVKEVLEDKVVKPKSISVIGGPAEIMAPSLEKAFGIPTRFPKESLIANAIGSALSKPTSEVTLLADTEKQTLSVPELNIYRKIDRDYNLMIAKKDAYEFLASDDVEITEESSFNMIDGMYRVGKNIRVKAQIKPGLLYNLRSESNNDKGEK